MAFSTWLHTCPGVRSVWHGDSHVPKGPAGCTLGTGEGAPLPPPCQHLDARGPARGQVEGSLSVVVAQPSLEVRCHIARA